MVKATAVVSEVCWSWYNWGRIVLLACVIVRRVKDVVEDVLLHLPDLGVPVNPALDISLVLLSTGIEVILDAVVPALLDDLLGLLPREEQVPDEGESPVQVVLVVFVVFCPCCVPTLYSW